MLSCSSLILADDSAEATTPDWKAKTKDAAQSISHVVAEGAATGYVAAKESFHDSVNYFKNNTVEGVAQDAVDGAKSVGGSIADGAKKVWDGIGNWFSWMTHAIVNINLNEIKLIWKYPTR